MLDLIRRALIWIAFEVRLGPLNPYIFGFGLAMGCRPPKRSPEDERQWLIDHAET